MNPEQLLVALDNREDGFTERKPEGPNSAELRQTGCAFANSVPEGRVGVLFVGVHDKTGEILGVNNPDDMQKRLRRLFQTDCYPPIEYQATVLEKDAKPIIAIEFPYSANKPHFTGPAYVRTGSESVNATPRQYEEMILSRTDKTREILLHKDKVFTVLGLGYQVGSNKYIPDAGYRESRECRIESCTGHTVTMNDISTGETITEPLKRVMFSWDERKYRPMLMVSFA
jgi:predicted HTH transcriptional regulator